METSLLLDVATYTTNPEVAQNYLVGYIFLFLHSSFVRLK